MAEEKKLEGPIYGVPWIEVEYGWGERPEGYLLFTDLEQCIEDTKEASKRGNGHGGYVGPVRPLCYYEIPVEGLDDELVDKLVAGGKCFTNNYWSPKYHSAQRSIT